MFPHTDDNNLDEEKQDDLPVDESLEEEIAVPFEDVEKEEEDNF